MTRDCWGIARSKAQPDISGSKSTTRWRLRSKSTFSAPETLGAERRAVGALFFDIHAGAKRRGRAAKRFIPFSVRSETANRQPPVGRFFFAERHKHSCCLARLLSIRDRRRSLDRAGGARRGQRFFRGRQIGIFLMVHASPDAPFCERRPHARRREWRCEDPFQHLYRLRKTHRV